MFTFPLIPDMESNHIPFVCSAGFGHPGYLIGRQHVIPDIYTTELINKRVFTLKPSSHAVLFLPKHHSTAIRYHVTDTEAFSVAMSSQCSPNWNRCGAMRRRWPREEGRYVVIMCTSHRTHVIGVCLPSQSASKKHNQKAHTPLRTSPWISPKIIRHVW